VNITGAGFVSLLLLYHPPDLSSPGIPLPAGRVDRRRPSMSYAGQHITLTPSRTSHPRAMPHQFYSRPPVRPSVRSRRRTHIYVTITQCVSKEWPIKRSSGQSERFFSVFSHIYLSAIYSSFFFFLRATLLPSLIKRDRSLSLSLSCFDECRIEIPKLGFHLQLVGEQGVSLSMRIPEAYFIKRHFLFRSITTRRLFDFLVKGKVVPPSEECAAACVGYHRYHPVFAHVRRTWLPPAFLERNCVHETFRETVSASCRSSRWTLILNDEGPRYSECYIA